MFKNKGITLIALVITIIVLLILAGVTLNLIAGSDGILEKAMRSGRKDETSFVKRGIRAYFSSIENGGTAYKAEIYQ